MIWGMDTGGQARASSGAWGATRLQPTMDGDGPEPVRGQQPLTSSITERSFVTFADVPSGGTVDAATTATADVVSGSLTYRCSGGVVQW